MSSVFQFKMSVRWKNENTPVSEAFDDIYYAVEDGLSESRYVFLEANQVPEKLQSMRELSIAELGFGTGLNFFATYHAWKQGPRNPLSYWTVEKYPLSADEIQRALGHWPELNEELQEFSLLYNSSEQGLQEFSMASGSVQLHIFFGDVLNFFEKIEAPIHAWYLDGFAPSKNSEMWSEEVFKLAASKSEPATSFSSFASAGFVRRNLAAAGFEVLKQKGFGRKREMIRGHLK